MGFHLRHDGFDFPILPGATLVGRSIDCQVMLLSNRVSRHHAKLTEHDGKLTIEDLDSANGVIVNGKPLRKPTALAAGDEIVLGDEVLYVVIGTPKPESVLHPSWWARGKRSRPKDGTDIRSLLSKVTNRMFSRVRLGDTESDLHPRLREVLSQARMQAELPAGIAERAARNAVRLAEADQDPVWIEYAFELHTALRKPLPLDVIDKLYTLLLVIPPVRAETLRVYVEVLNVSKKNFPPAQRFLVRRIRGLQRLAPARDPLGQSARPSHD